MHFCPVHSGSHPRPDGRLSAVQHFQRGRAAAGLARRHRRNAAGHDVHVSAAPRHALEAPAARAAHAGALERRARRLGADVLHR